jgi:hypothetical protein
MTSLEGVTGRSLFPPATLAYMSVEMTLEV